MLLMASANHLLMVFIAVEMASLPSYAMAGFLKGKRTGSEAALKYVIYGAGASGVMLYGITLLSGTFGTGYLPNIAEGVARHGLDLPVLAGFALVLVGLGFKLAAVPFHFWCPDVFEGAAAEVAGFLSVTSKAAAIALTARLLLTLQVHQVQLHPQHAWVVPEALGLGVGIIAASTITFGNLAAFGQNNLKRLLAYSTIAHAGYMLLAAATISEAGAASILYYLIVYIAMNLGAFAVVALVRNTTRSEELSAYRGLIQRSPVLAITMTVFLLSLLGLPPFAGLPGKYQLFQSVYDFAKHASASGHANLGNAFYVLLGVASVNVALSAYYYLKVVRMMLLESPEGEAASEGGAGERRGALPGLSGRSPRLICRFFQLHCS
jgi:NADH-quinone oxidoreductase subunit N